MSSVSIQKTLMGEERGFCGDEQKISWFLWSRKSVHARQNAFNNIVILSFSRKSCSACLKIIVNCGIISYWSTDSEILLLADSSEDINIEVRQSGLCVSQATHCYVIQCSL